MPLLKNNKSTYFSNIAVNQTTLNRSKGILTAGKRQISCALGRSGISFCKREGDGATPAGIYRFVSAYYRPDREIRRTTGLRVNRIASDLGWCDEPADRNYNRAVKLPYNSSHEKMHRNDGLYDWCLVIDQNYFRRVHGRGSAIFFHMAAPDFKPTEGCIAVQPQEMRWLLGHIGKSTRLIVG